jgi:ABC-2 type transport system permease protein
VNGRRLAAIIRKEFIQLVRDRATLTIILALPVVMLLIFGYAVSTDVQHIPTAVYDQDASQESRALVQRFANSGYFDLVRYASTLTDLRSAIEGGEAKVGLVIPPDYSRLLARGETAQVQAIIDGSDPLSATTALSTAQVVAQAYAQELLAARLAKQGVVRQAALPIEMRPRVWYNPELKSLRFNLPGLVGVILQNVTILLTAFALVREKERGTIEQLIVTPVRPTEMIAGKLIPYVVVGFVEVGLALGVSVLWFGVPVAGSIWLLLAVSLVFLIGALGIGIFVSTIAKSQFQAQQITMAFLLPSFILSGFIFPREVMPVPIQVVGYFIPLTYFLRVLRGIIVKGVGLHYLWREVAMLGLYGAAILALAVSRFRKRLD